MKNEKYFNLRLAPPFLLLRCSGINRLPIRVLLRINRFLGFALRCYVCIKVLPHIGKKMSSIKILHFSGFSGCAFYLES